MICGRTLPVRRLLVIVVALAAPGTWIASAQTNAGDNSGASNATRLLVCEAADDSCLQVNPHYASSWSFDGTTGVVTSSASDSNVQLTIEGMSQDKIVIRRVDPSGRSAVYSGTSHGNTMSGTVQWFSNAHADAPTSGKWSGVFQGAPAAATSSTDAVGTPSQGAPLRLIECESNGPCNGAWSFDGLSGTATWFAQSAVHAKLTIVRSDQDEITIRRTNLTDGNSAVYHGVRKGDTYAGAVIWSSPNNPGGASGHWTATIPQTNCDEGSNMTPADAKRIGQNALMFDLERDAFGCYIVAAKAGDALAQTAVGLIYYKGNTNEIPQDYKQAFFWLQKAADQGVYAAQRTVSDMYMLGQGTPKDRELSKFYGDKAEEQKRDRQHQIERAEDRADHAADRAANAMTGFVMGAVFGALLF